MLSRKLSDKISSSELVEEKKVLDLENDEHNTSVERPLSPNKVDEAAQSKSTIIQS